MKVGKLLGLITGLLVLVSFFRLINGAGDLDLNSILLKIQSFKYDSTTVLDLYQGFEVLKDYPMPFDPIYEDGNVDLNVFFILTQYFVDSVKWTLNLFTGIIWPVIRLFYDSLVLCGDVLEMFFSLLGFIQT